MAKAKAKVATAKPAKSTAKKATKKATKVKAAPRGRVPKYGAPSRMVRRAHKWPVVVDHLVTEIADRERTSLSCTIRRALLAYGARILGPNVVGRSVQDLAERAFVIELAERDPEAAARSVFRD